MAALATPRDTKQHSGIEMRRVVKSGVTVYKGAAVGVNTSSTAQPMAASVAGGLKCLGVAQQTVVGDGVLTVDIVAGSFEFHNSTSTDAIAAKDGGAVAYAADDQTAALTSATSTRPVLGRIVGLADNGNVIVTIGPAVA